MLTYVPRQKEVLFDSIGPKSNGTIFIRENRDSERHMCRIEGHVKTQRERRPFKDRGRNLA